MVQAGGSFRPQDFDENGVAVLNVGCIKWGESDESKLHRIPERKALEFSRYTIEASDILFTRSGSIERCAVANERHSGLGKLCVSEFLRILFERASEIEAQTTAASVTTSTGSNRKFLTSCDIPLTPYREQIRIADDVDKRMVHL